MGEDAATPWMDDPRPTMELFNLARHELRNEDPDDICGPLCVLFRRGRRDGEEIFRIAERWCASAEAAEREVATRILAQLGQPADTYHGKSVDLLIARLADPTTAVIAGAAQGLGHRRDPAAIPCLLPLVDHSDADVRFGVMAGLSGQNDPRAIAALIKLTSDDDRAVRDWATFGIGSLTAVDTPELRDALVSRLVDLDHATRNEALIGLAERQDIRVVEPLIRELSGPYHGTGAIEAAEIMGRPVFYEYLVPLRALIEKHQPWFLQGYEDALTACQSPPDE